MAGFARCKSLSAHPKDKETPAEKYLPRRVSETQQSLETAELDNAHWRPGPGNLAHGTFFRESLDRDETFPPKMEVGSFPRYEFSVPPFPLDCVLYLRMPALDN